MNIQEYLEREVHFKSYTCARCQQNYSTARTDSPVGSRVTYYKVGSSVFCPACAEWETVCCQYCNERILKADNRGNDETPRCFSCSVYRGYISEEEAEQIKHESEMADTYEDGPDTYLY